MKPTQELVDELFRHKVRRARATPPEEKFMAGPELFDNACRVMADGIRGQFPTLDDERVRSVLRERLALLRRLEGGD